MTATHPRRRATPRSRRGQHVERAAHCRLSQQRVERHLLVRVLERERGELLQVVAERSSSGAQVPLQVLVGDEVEQPVVALLRRPPPRPPAPRASRWYMWWPNSCTISPRVTASACCWPRRIGSGVIHTLSLSQPRVAEPLAGVHLDGEHAAGELAAGDDAPGERAARAGGACCRATCPAACATTTSARVRSSDASFISAAIRVVARRRGRRRLCSSSSSSRPSCATCGPAASTARTACATSAGGTPPSTVRRPSRLVPALGAAAWPPSLRGAAAGSRCGRRGWCSHRRPQPQRATPPAAGFEERGDGGDDARRPRRGPAARAAPPPPFWYACGCGDVASSIARSQRPARSAASSRSQWACRNHAVSHGRRQTSQQRWRAPRDRRARAAPRPIVEQQLAAFVANREASVHTAATASPSGQSGIDSAITTASGGGGGGASAAGRGGRTPGLAQLDQAERRLLHFLRCSRRGRTPRAGRGRATAAIRRSTSGSAGDGDSRPRRAAAARGESTQLGSVARTSSGSVRPASRRRAGCRPCITVAARARLVHRRQRLGRGQAHVAGQLLDQERAERRPGRASRASPSRAHRHMASSRATVSNTWRQSTIDGSACAHRSAPTRPSAQASSTSPAAKQCGSHRCSQQLPSSGSVRRSTPTGSTTGGVELLQELAVVRGKDGELLRHVVHRVVAAEQRGARRDRQHPRRRAGAGRCVEPDRRRLAGTARRPRRGRPSRTSRCCVRVAASSRTTARR